MALLATPPPPEKEEEGGADPLVAVFITTSLHTRLVVGVRHSVTIAGLKSDMMIKVQAEDILIELGESYPSFDLEKAVCNHGMFMMAPNRWISEISTLQRPLRLADAAASVTVSISQQVQLDSHRIIIRIHDPHPHLSSEDYQVITKQVLRMLRIFERDERMMDEFHRLHPQAKEDGFGRIFRSPSLFEDTVKIMLLCNCDWPRTLKMARALCWLQLKIANGEIEMLCNNQQEGDSQERWEIDGLIGDFPSAREIISLKKKGIMKKWCKVGYREKYIIELAKKVVNGKILDEIERMGMAGEETQLIQMKKRITRKRGIKGIGDFGYNVLLMCVGVYSHVPIDSETRQHMKMVMNANGKKKKTMNKEEMEMVYHKYAPFQSLVYWWEKIKYYESRLGKLSELAPENYYKVTSGNNMK